MLFITHNVIDYIIINIHVIIVLIVTVRDLSINIKISSFLNGRASN